MSCWNLLILSAISSAGFSFLSALPCCGVSYKHASTADRRSCQPGKKDHSITARYIIIVVEPHVDLLTSRFVCFANIIILVLIGVQYRLAGQCAVHVRHEERETSADESRDFHHAHAALSMPTLESARDCIHAQYLIWATIGFFDTSGPRKHEWWRACDRPRAGIPRRWCGAHRIHRFEDLHGTISAQRSPAQMLRAVRSRNR